MSSTSAAAVEHVSRDEVEAHKAAMRLVVEDSKRERNDLNELNKRAANETNGKTKCIIKAADDEMDRSIKEARETMCKVIGEARKAADEAIEAARMEAQRTLAAAENETKKKESLLLRSRNSKLASMRRDFEHLPLLRQVYHEAPDDVFELIISKCSEVHKYGSAFSLNPFRLVNKRCKRAVESCATEFSDFGLDNEIGSHELPVQVLQKFGRIDSIRCYSNINSFNGCPTRMKKFLLWARESPDLSDLSPLASCSMMETLIIHDSSITDISAVASMPLLEELTCWKLYDGRPSIKDIMPLSFCPRLKHATLIGNKEIFDITPLSTCSYLEHIGIGDCPLIPSLAPLSSLYNLKVLAADSCSLISSLTALSGLTNLERLYIDRCPLITSLAPLSTLVKMTDLSCWKIASQTSLSHLRCCTALKSLTCDEDAVDLDEIRSVLPLIKIEHHLDEEMLEW